MISTTCTTRITSALPRQITTRLSKRWITTSFANSQKSFLLPPPTVLLSNNHIVVVNKPPGWHSVPNDAQTTSNMTHSPGAAALLLQDPHLKCLLTYLQASRLGGGSQKAYLKPIHRIDQPCSGLLVWAKTTKAAQRITKVWKTKQVTKTYVCLVPVTKLEKLMDNSQPEISTTGSRGWWMIHGYQHSAKVEPSNSANAAAGWNVNVKREEPVHAKSRPVSAVWRQIELPTTTTTQTNATTSKLGVIMVQTNIGARHMVRALLAQVGQCPIHGDRRYGPQRQQQQQQNQLGFSKDHPQVVGLHAYSVQLPEPPILKLGPNSPERYFQAPLPDAWKGMLGSEISLEMMEEAILHNIADVPPPYLAV